MIAPSHFEMMIGCLYEMIDDRHFERIDDCHIERIDRFILDLLRTPPVFSK